MQRREGIFSAGTETKTKAVKNSDTDRRSFLALRWGTLLMGP